MKVTVVGEAMLEYRSQSGIAGGLQYGGDTLNTAIHMVRSGCEVSYVTALGVDPISTSLLANWQKEGLDTSLVLHHPTRHPGIYAIHLDDQGERSFLYWRESSAARELFELPGIEKAAAAIAESDLLYFSHISLAILPPSGREALMALAEQARVRGRQVAYDSNYRPRLWENEKEARTWSNRAIASASIGLPTREDEVAMYGQTNDAESIARHWQSLGCPEVIVKRGPEGPLVVVEDAEPYQFPCSTIPMVDSSGAGDAFNGAYLSARISGKSPFEAARLGHELAAWVISQPGALPPLPAESPYNNSILPEIQP